MTVVRGSFIEKTFAVSVFLVAFLLALICRTGVSEAVTGRADRGSVTYAEIAKARTLQSQIGKVWTASYRARWIYRYKGKVSTFTLEQAPPLTRFIASDGAFDETNREHDFFNCASGAGCPSVNGVDPLFQTRNLFVGVEMSDELGGFNTTPANAPTGFTLEFSTATYAGLSSTCVSFYDGTTLSQTWCIAKNGVVTFGKYAGRLLTLTDYASGVKTSSIEIPKSARIVSI